MLWAEVVMALIGVIVVRDTGFLRHASEHPLVLLAKPCELSDSLQETSVVVMRCT